jgi:uncharacterized protein YoxC
MRARVPFVAWAEMPATALQRLFVPAFATIMLAAGCGGDGNGGGTTSPTEWADGLCSATTTWTESLTSSAQSLQGGALTKESLQGVTDDVKDSTKTYVDDVKGLGKPDTEAGQQAKEELDGLADDLNDGVEKIDMAADEASGTSGVLGAISSISSTLQMTGQQVSSSLEQLEQLDSAGELEQGFQEADSCDQLRSSGG